MWFILLIFLFSFLCWFFLAPLELRIDTKIPEISLRWVSIAKAMVFFESDKWWLNVYIGVFHKKWDLEKLIFASRKSKGRAKAVRKKRRKRGMKMSLRKFLTMLNTCRVIKWQISLDTGDEVKNAWLYPLNFFPSTRRHVNINFTDETWLQLTIRNAPWRLTYAFLK